MAQKNKPGLEYKTKFTPKHAQRGKESRKNPKETRITNVIGREKWFNDICRTNWDMTN